MQVATIYQIGNKSTGIWQPIVDGHFLRRCDFTYKNKIMKFPDIDLAQFDEGDEVYIDIVEEKIIIADEETSFYYKMPSNEERYIGPLIICRNGKIYIIKHIQE